MSGALFVLAVLWGACVAASFLLLLSHQVRGLTRAPAQRAAQKLAWQRLLRVTGTGTALVAPAYLGPRLAAVAVLSFSLARLWMLRRCAVGHGR